MSRLDSLDLYLHPKQGLALQTQANEVLYGGAAGGGKSHLMRVAAIMWCTAIPGLQVYLFRRIRDDLIKNHMEGPSGFRVLLAGWVACGFATIVEDQIRFWNGSKIYLCHCKDEKDVYKYQGAEIHVLLVDELTHFTETMYRFLRNRVRMVGIDLPNAYEGAFPRILCGANPGNIGHVWVKSTFVTSAQPLEIRQMSANEGGMRRQYIPAKLEDNPSMAESDPGYENRLSGLGSEALVRAMRHGDWDIIEGAFFDCWSSDLHVIRPVQLPGFWFRYRSGDWGSASPFSFGWWAVATDDFWHPQDNVVLPRGSLIRYREWYGVHKDNDGMVKANVGLKLTAEQVARGIKDREANENIAMGVLDPSAFAEDGGPSIASRMANEGVHFQRADNARVIGRGAMGGWDQMRARLIGTAGRPAIYCFSTCVDSIRTIPALQHDPNRPEDLNTDMEDHAADDWRYACMARPYIKPAEVEPPSPRYKHRRTSRGSGSSWMAA
jgi:hypothetical protein